MDQTYEKLQPYLEKAEALGAALTLLSWDNETLAPKGAIERTSKMIGVLSMEHYHTIMNDEVKAILAELKAAEGLDAVEKKVVENLQRDYDQMEKIPPQEYQEYAELQAQAGALWAAAKQQDDYSMFAPCLEKMIEYNKRFAGYRAKPGQKLFDVLLDDFERDMDMEKLDAFFGKMKAEIVPLLKKIVEKDQIDNSFLKVSYEVGKQREFNRFLVEYIGFDFDRGVTADSEHPFTTNLHNHDVRFTNHYHEYKVDSAMFSTIHEGGHGIYEQGISDEISMTPLGSGASMGMHESQSRFYENIVGRSEAFWEPIYGKLVELFPEQLGDVPVGQFVKAVNRVEPSLVRTESDELTYCLHIMVRYEIEKKIFAGELKVADLPEAWNRLYEEYLGVAPKSYSDGVLQDVHWSMGSFGYFPSYALGNAIAAQIYHQMKKEMDFDALLREGKLSEIKDYLGKHVHQFGMLKNTDDMLREMTGEPFNADYYVEYLKEKFTRIYEL